MSSLSEYPSFQAFSEFQKFQIALMQSNAMCYAALLVTLSPVTNLWGVDGIALSNNSNG